MKYEQAREFVKNGDVLTFSGSWLFSKLVRWWTGQPVSHIGLAVWLKLEGESEDRLCILESIEPYGVRILPLSTLMPEYLASGAKVYWQSYIGGNGSEVLGYAMQQWGNKYASWFQFLAFISPSFRKLRVRFHKSVKIGTGVTCSELVARAFSEAGMVNHKDPVMMTPGDFFDSPYLSVPEELS